MNSLSSKIRLLATTVASLAIALPTAPAQAYRIFFGEDLNLGSTNALSASPQSRAAETNFLNGLTNVGTETFEGFGAGTAGSLNLNFGSAGIATLQGGGVVRSNSQQNTNFGRYAVSGSKFWQADASGHDFGVGFSQSVAAFGFYGVDIGDFGGVLNLTLTLAQGGTRQMLVPNTPGWQGYTNGSILYFGVIAENASEVFNSVSFNLNAPGEVDIFAFDNMTIGSLAQVKGAIPPPTVEANIPQGNGVPPTQNVPEPGTLLAGLACLGLGGAAKRWRKRQR
ncbi:MAG: PEP-CTERM sorting domain-containing protein [Spirulina sp. SIO3F2]|nr:PEP-CTERM sorting domain-containing protein [Spirulina sp. SIO3F2]